MIDFDKFARYSAPMPRYTSYPTAPEFRDDWTLDDLKASIARSNETARALSIYVHLPFCRSACYFCGCNVIYTSKEGQKDEYIVRLQREMEIFSSLLDTRREVRQIHFGGGTPTFFGAAQLEQIIKALYRVFPNVSDRLEFGVEIDPRFFTEDQMRAMSDGGVNRISFGVQDFDPKVQAAVHRVQPFELNAKAVALARKYGAKSVNIDLLYGLPHQSVFGFCRTIEQALELKSDRVALFNYAHLPWLKNTMRNIDETALPSAAEKLKMFQSAVEIFGANGFEMIGMDHFAKLGDELHIALKEGRLRRNFQGYTTHNECDLFGFGVTSISEGADFYSQNFRKLDDYDRAIDEGKPPFMRGIALNCDDRLRKRVIMGLMSVFALDFAAVEKEFGIAFEEYFAPDLEALKPLEADGLLTIENRRIAISDTGRLLIRNIVANFDPYLKKSRFADRRFSKSV
ncbi:MAG: oxygen-independent coproporphyrinogen III oxidase [Helicobacteraceae bacterium]|jgi:oxygen-independent coproporphyrinogen-3 oxidase|nr:oxygen-independent coproporphyrinogen III oxidase [Helicobacteraceae bacterium]